MKIGKKGFMLAEVVIISVVVGTVLITLYIGLNNVVSAYDTRNRYYDIDCLYAAMEVNEVLLRNNPEIIKNDVALDLSTNGDVNSFELFYKEKVGYNINLYLTPYNLDKMISIKEKNISATFVDYLDYLSGNLDFEENYDYMIIVEKIDLDDIDDCYYYALKLKY